MGGRKAWGLGSDAETDSPDEHDAPIEQPHASPTDSPLLLRDEPPPYAPGRVRLLKPHTHAGKDYAAGDEIEASVQLQDWLRQHGVCA